MSGVEIAIKKQLKSSIDKPGIKRCQGAIEIAWKTVFFKEEKNTNMNAIKHATQSRIQSTFWPLKNISQQKKWQAFWSQNTHKLNKSNQFYISKTSQDSLVSIH